MRKISLDGKYQGNGFSEDGQKNTFEAFVPGCVHTDLIQNGMIKDLFVGMNAEKYRYLENWDFEFSRTFNVDSICGNEYLLFEGLDTFCDIYLNDVLVGTAEDMFLEYRYPVKDILLIGENQLKIKFYSATKKVKHLPQTSAPFDSGRIYIRRMQCSFGWDWVERFVTCGIWKSVSLCIPDKTELEDVYIHTNMIDDFSAQLGIELEFTGDFSNSFVALEIKSPVGKTVYTKQKRIVEGTLRESVDIINPQLWWVNGYGQQPLYRLMVSIICDGCIISERTVSFGIRTIRIVQITDLSGSNAYEKALELQKTSHLTEVDRNECFSGFTVVVNGIPIMCKGANWVPPEPFASDVRNEKYMELLRLAADGGFNMLRVWGGGIFESDFFYEQCDRLGILVTQDFLMACAVYPEQEHWFASLVEKEAKQVAKRLRNHPSLAWWTGDNEIGGNNDENDPHYPGRKIAMETVLPILEKYDRYRVFMPTSPYGGTLNKSATKGTTHNTFFLECIADYLSSGEMKEYQAYFKGFLARFSSEEPVMGAPSYFSLKKFMTDEEIFGNDDAMWRYHTKNHPAPRFSEFGLYDMLVQFAKKLYGDFTSGQDKLFKLQVLQYEWVRITMENVRRNKWFSSGMLYWMFNDCWTASGWALIDYYCLPKAGYYSFKRSAGKVITSIDKISERYYMYICSDAPEKILCNYRLFLQSTQSPDVLIEFRGNYEVPANTTVCNFSVSAEEIDRFMSNSTILLCELQSNTIRDIAYYLPQRPQDINFCPVEIQIIEKAEDFIVLFSDQFVFSVRLDGEFVFEDNFFSLLPRQKKKIKFRSSYGASNHLIEIHALNQNFQEKLYI